MTKQCVVIDLEVLKNTIAILTHGTLGQRLAYRDKLRALLAACKTFDPIAWGQPDAAGNIVDSISPDEKITDMKEWADQYSVALYAEPNLSKGQS